MNKLSFFTRLLAYSLVNPKVGKQLLVAKYQSWQDSHMQSLLNYKQKDSSLEDIIKRLFPHENISITELKKNTAILQNHINDFFNSLKNENYPSKKKPYPLDYALDDRSGLFLYILCKITKPDKVLETGVAYGLSSMYVLQALSENNKGMLYSIDGIFTPWQSKETIGKAIPSHLRERWKLIIGVSSEKLNETLSSIGTVDIFFHDSLHTYKNMMFEFDTTWPFIRKNGFLVSDDISSNNAFYEFHSKLQIEPLILSQKENTFLGILKKQSTF
ncbi:MAG: class I SAM-dependent methyltransferase [Candidatus Nitrosotenuis sp.]